MPAFAVTDIETLQLVANNNWLVPRGAALMRSGRLPNNPPTLPDEARGTCCPRPSSKESRRSGASSADRHDWRAACTY